MPESTVCPACGARKGERDGSCPHCAPELALDGSGQATNTLLGRMLLHYRLVAKIGQGGMGVVWKAIDDNLRREVAVKFLPGEFVDDPKRLARFEREARLLASLNHPNIAAVYGLHQSEQGERFLAMELVEGEELAARIGRGPIDPEEALDIARQIAEALECAHDNGVIHRDLKPSNIMIAADGRVRVLDLGLAKALPTDSSEGDTADPSRRRQVDQLTREGEMFGTPAYMSPEQALGRAVDRRADTWSFGCVLYEMLTGRPAFMGESVSDTIASVLRSEPDLRQLPVGTPEVAVRLVLRCMRKDRRRRLQSIGEARIAIEERQDEIGGDSAATPTPRGSHSGPVRLLVTLALLGAGGALILLALNRGSVPPQGRAAIRFEIAPPATGGFESGIALSPDGSNLAFVAPGAKGEDVLWVRPLSNLASRELPGTEGASYPFWSPRGDRIAFFARGRLKTIEIADEEIQTLSVAPEPRGGSWSEQGGILFAVRAGGGIVRLPPMGSVSATVIGNQASDEQGPIKFPCFLPDGRHFLFHKLTNGPETGLWLGRIDSTESSFFLPADSGAQYMSPGFLVYRKGTRLIARRFDAERREVSGPAMQITEDAWHDVTGSYLTAFSVSAAGHLAYRTGGAARSSLVWTDRSGREIDTLGPPGTYFEPALSPDGCRLTFARASEDSSKSSIWTYDIARGALARLSPDTGISVTPLWSLDGGTVYYTTFPSGEVLRRNGTGAGDEETAFTNDRFSLLLDWSRDGPGLFLQSIEFRTYRHDLLVRSLAIDAEPRQLLSGPFNHGGARISPDGRWLAYHTDASGVPEIYVLSYPDLARRWQISNNGGTQPRWREDGRELFFMAADRNMMSVDIRASLDFDPTLPRVLFATRILPLIEARNHYDVTPDGQRFVVNSRRPEDATLPIVVITDLANEMAGD